MINVGNFFLQEPFFESNINLNCLLDRIGQAMYDIHIMLPNGSKKNIGYIDIYIYISFSQNNHKIQ